MSLDPRRRRTITSSLLLPLLCVNLVNFVAVTGGAGSVQAQAGPASDVLLEGAPQQGALLRGTAPAGTGSLTLDGKPVPVELKNVRINGRYYSNVYGGGVPATIFRDTMRSALEGVEERSFERPGPLPSSRERFRVPVVAGLPLAEAERVLIRAGLSVSDGGRVSGTRYARGTAASTSPRAGRRVDVGDTVVLYEGSRR